MMERCRNFYWEEVVHSAILCAYSDEEAVHKDNIKEGFEIGNVDIEALHAMHDDLAVDGEVQCNRGDYRERVGLTHSPISTLAI